MLVYINNIKSVVLNYMKLNLKFGHGNAWALQCWGLYPMVLELAPCDDKDQTWGLSLARHVSHPLSCFPELVYI